MSVRIELNDILQVPAEAVVNPANSSCSMGGGVAEVLKNEGGQEIEDEAMAKGPVLVGDAIITDGGSLPFQYVIHAPTMEDPKIAIPKENVGSAMRAALKKALELGVRTISIPGLGTGIGRVPLDEAAAEMIEAISGFKAEGIVLPDIVLVAKDKRLYEAWEESIKTRLQPD